MNDTNNHVGTNSHLQPPSSSTASQQSLEFPTQNELTQLGDVDEHYEEEEEEEDEYNSADEEGNLCGRRRRKRRDKNLLLTSSPVVNLREIPWGRLVPAAATQNVTAVHLFPRDPQIRITPNHSQERTVSFLGLNPLLLSDRFNEYTLGRSNKCDVVAHKNHTDNNPNSSPDWVHAMISNRHCRIFTMLAKACAQSQRTDMEVYVEDTSGNGTLVNQSILLQRGERRELHTGDTICLINPNTLKKKIHSITEQQDILSQYTWIFINLYATAGTSLFKQNHQETTQAATTITTTTSTNKTLTLLQAQNTHTLPPPHTTKHKTDIMPPPPSPLIQGILRVPSLQKVQQQLFNGPIPIQSETDSLFCTTTNNNDASHSRPCRVANAQADCNSQQESDTVSSSWIEPDKKNMTVLNQTLDMPPPEKKRRSSPRLISRDKNPRFEAIYDVRDVLGSGTCGEVRRAIHRQSGKVVAVKIISTPTQRNPTTQSHTASFLAEAHILQQLHHPYIVQFYQVFVQPPAVYLVMELLQGGDLLDRILLKGRYSETTSRQVMRRLFAAIFYLHEECNIVHRDLKPENILCVSKDNDIMIKLTDFGLAKSVSQEGCKTFCGTPQYFAPEVLRRHGTITGRGRYGKEADMWSLGIILYVLLSGEPPFDVSAGMEAVEKACICFDPDRWSGISDNAKDLILKLLIKDPKERINIGRACRHVWILEDDGDSHTYPLDDPLLTTVHLSSQVMMHLKTENHSPPVMDRPSSETLSLVEENPSLVHTSTTISDASFFKSKRRSSRATDTDENIDLLSPNQAANFPSPFTSSASAGGNSNLKIKLRRGGDASLFSCVKQLSKTETK